MLRTFHFFFVMFGMKSTRAPNGTSLPLKCPFLCRLFQQLSPSTISVFSEKQKNLAASGQKQLGIPACVSNVRVPPKTVSFRRSTCEFVSWIPGADVPYANPKSPTAFLISSELSEYM